MNPASKITVESLVVQDKAAPAIVAEAIFEAVEAAGKIGVVLDKAPTKFGLYSVLLHLPAQDLVETSRSACEVRYRNIGKPIEVWDYLHLSDDQRGFYVRS
jgi:hypothetical protein